MESKHIVIALAFSLFSSCSGGDESATFERKPNFDYSTSKKVDLTPEVAAISRSLAIIKPVPKVEDPEICNDKDDDKDGMIDEGCFGCFPGAKPGDFNNDGSVTMLDGNAPLLIANNKTVAVQGAGCMDLNKNGAVGMDDTLAVIDLVHQAKF